MKTFRKFLPFYRIKRYLEINQILINSNIKTPRILHYDKESVTLQYIDGIHEENRWPNIEQYHNCTNDYHRIYNLEVAESKLNNVGVKKTHAEIALSYFEKAVNQEKSFKFIHSDSHFYNYLFVNKDTYWIDIHDSMIGPPSLDTFQIKAMRWKCISQIPITFSSTELYIGIYYSILKLYCCKNEDHMKIYIPVVKSILNTVEKQLQIETGIE